MLLSCQSLKSFFAWEEAGLGRVCLSCPCCNRVFELRLLQNIMESTCPNCACNAGFERSRAFEREHGPLETAKCLKELGMVTDVEHRHALKRWRRGLDSAIAWRARRWSGRTSS